MREEEEDETERKTRWKTFPLFLLTEFSHLIISIMQSSSVIYKKRAQNNLISISVLAHIQCSKLLVFPPKTWSNILLGRFFRYCSSHSVSWVVTYQSSKCLFHCCRLLSHANSSRECAVRYLFIALNEIFWRSSSSRKANGEKHHFKVISWLCHNSKCCCFSPPKTNNIFVISRTRSCMLFSWWNEHKKHTPSRPEKRKKKGKGRNRKSVERWKNNKNRDLWKPMTSCWIYVHVRETLTSKKNPQQYCDKRARKYDSSFWNMKAVFHVFFIFFSIHLESR